MPPNRFESEVESFLEGSHGDRTHIKRADHHTVTPLCGTLLCEHAGRQIPRTARRNMATLKPTTPLHAPNKGPLKPPSPLHPKNAPKTPISHPHRRWWFQTHTGTSKQRRQGFQLRLSLREQRRRRFHTTGPPGRQGQAAVPAGCQVPGFV